LDSQNIHFGVRACHLNSAKIAYRTRARSGMSACPSFGPAMMLPVAAPYCAGVSNGRDEDLIDKFRHGG
jgi:hypothetical protein